MTQLLDSPAQHRQGPMIQAVEGDLRPVTILFADVRGFTRLAEVLPAEQLVAAINGCFEVPDTPIAHYGGEVDKFLGDAVMATFGAPTAHDDDPRRAVLAALEMQAALRKYNTQLRKQIGCELEMRVGSTTAWLPRDQFAHPPNARSPAMANGGNAALARHPP